MRAQSQNVAQERQQTSPETNVGSNSVAAREFLHLTPESKWYIVLRGQEAEDQHKVGVQQVIQGPDHIEAVVDHHAGSHDLGHIVLVRPISSEVALLLPRQTLHTPIQETDQRRSKPRTPQGEKQDAENHSIMNEKQEVLPIHETSQILGRHSPDSYRQQ